MSVDTFRRRLKRLSTLRCNVLPMPEALDALRTGALPARAVVITIDDGWASTFDYMLPELSRYRYPATVYVQTAKLISGAPVHDVAIQYALSTTTKESVTLAREIFDRAHIAEVGPLTFKIREPMERTRLSKTLHQIFEHSSDCARSDLLGEVFDRMCILHDDIDRSRTFHLGTQDEVRSAASAGFEIALHTHTHSLGDLSYTAVKSEIDMNRRILGAIVDRPHETFQHFCWPNGNYTETASRHLAALGISAATTCDYGLTTGDSNALQLPRILDGERTGSAEFVAQLSGIKSLLSNERRSRRNFC